MACCCLFCNVPIARLATSRWLIFASLYLLQFRSLFRLRMSPCNDPFSGLAQFSSTSRTNLSSSVSCAWPSQHQRQSPISSTVEYWPKVCGPLRRYSVPHFLKPVATWCDKQMPTHFPALGCVCKTQTRVPPVAAEGGTSKEEQRRQRRRQRALYFSHRSPIRHVELRWTIQRTKESLYSDCPDLDVEKAIEIAQDKEKWKKIRPSQRC